MSASRASPLVTEFATPGRVRDYFRSNYGPTIAVYRRSLDREYPLITCERA